MQCDRNSNQYTVGRGKGAKSSRHLRAIAAAVVVSCGGLMPGRGVFATVYSWDPGNTPATPSGGTGTWDLNNTVAWSDGTSDKPWTDTNGNPHAGVDADTAVFGGAAGTVTLNTPYIGANELVFNTSGYNLVSSGTINTSNGTGNILYLSSTATALDTTAIGAGTVTLPNVEIETNALPANGQTASPSQTWNTGAATVTVGGQLINFGSTNSLTINGTGTTNIAGGLALSYATSSKKFTILGNENINISGPIYNSINGSGGTANTFSYNGAGILTISGNNTYQGTTVFYAGSMVLGSNTALGTSAFTFGEPSSTFTPVIPTATLSATTPVTLSNPVLLDSQLSPSNGFPLIAIVGGSNPITFSGPFTGGTSTNVLVVNNSATTTISGPVSLSNTTSARTLNIKGTGNLLISGVIGDSNVSGGSASSLTYNGSAGSLTLSAANTYTGTTTFYSGTLNVSNNAALGTSTFIFGDPSTTVLPATSTATLVAQGGPIVLSNAVQISSSSTAVVPVTATIGGSNNLTFTGAITGTSGSNVLAVNNTATTTFSGPLYLYKATNASGGLTFTGSGNLTISGVISDALGATGTNPGNLNYNGSGTLTLSNANLYTGNTHVFGGTVVLAAVGALPGGTNLTIDPGGTVVAGTLTTKNSLTVTNLSVTGKLDLNDNGLIAHNSSIGAVHGYLGAGFNNGGWNGSSGIVSSTAANDTTHLTALGSLINDTGANSGISTGTALYASVNGASTVDGDVLVKYTYYGDANLSGTVDGSDYSLIDNGFINHLTGWYNGDFNYDNVVNGSDYTLIDNGFNRQGATLAGVLASPTAQISVAAVPEPASLGLLATGSMCLLGRRNRKAARV